jgi:hypothetical protein
MRSRHCILILGLVALLMTTEPLHSDEGLWLFNHPPKQRLKERYGFDAPQEWYTHLQKSSVRFNSGGSGSFVSADGLVMTNHHVALGTLQKISSKEKDYVKEGFYAKSEADEIKALDEELNVLMEIVDVTDKVKAAVGNMTGEKAVEARRGIINKLEEESLKQTGLRSNIITLYHGAQYHLYRFKRYTDVRLVFAPEQQIAFYGGDPENFNYPRHDLDAAFFRVYEDGKPAQIKDYLKWSKDGAKDSELVFVSGHPGHTDRLNTVAELEYLRDIGFPFLLQRLNRLEVMLTIYSQRGQEYERKAKDLLFSVANSRKARYYGLAGLQDPSVMAKKVSEEKRLRAAVAKDPSLKEVADAWDIVARVQKARAAQIKRYNMLEAGIAFNTTLFGIARTLVRAAEENAKPNEQRLEEFAESEKKSLELKLFSKRPLYPDFERAKLADSLAWMTEILGYDDPVVQQVLGGKSPLERGVELINGSKLFDVEVRKQLYEGGKSAIESSTDPLIRLAVRIDPAARKIRKTYEAEVQEPSKQAYDKIARAKFAVEGTNTYPDATFTLRLSYGAVKGYSEEGKHIPYETTIGGLYESAKEKNNYGPYELPKRWLERKDKLNLRTPFNFINTCDIIGGNSGSPVVNASGEVVGLIFDGNIQSLVWDFVYTDQQARAVAVSSPAIPEALRAVYDAPDLAGELESGRRR